MQWTFKPALHICVHFVSWYLCPWLYFVCFCWCGQGHHTLERGSVAKMAGKSLLSIDLIYIIQFYVLACVLAAVWQEGCWHLYQMYVVMPVCE